MSIKYNIIQTPITKATHAKYCVRPVYKTYADLEDIAKRISDGTSYSIPDVLGVFHAIAEEIARSLESGLYVKLKGLGNLYPSLGTTVPIVGPDHYISQNIFVKKVNLLWCKTLKDRLSFVKFERSKKFGSAAADAADRRENILSYLDQNGSITAGEIKKINNASSATSIRDINLLIDEGIVKSQYRGVYTLVTQ